MNEIMQVTALLPQNYPFSLGVSDSFGFVGEEEEEKC